MAPKTLLPAALLLAGTASAHFAIGYPAALSGANEDLQATGPCSGLMPMLDELDDGEVSDFYVDGSAIAHITSHNIGNWLYRATLDNDVAASSNWTQLYPVFEQENGGPYCSPMVTAPAEFVGQRGVLSIVSFSDHGNLYNCAAVNFVEGMSEEVDACTNGSSVTGRFTPDVDVTSLVGEDGEANPAVEEHEGHDGGDMEGGEGESEGTDEGEGEEGGEDADGAASLLSLRDSPLVMAIAPLAGLYFAFFA
jgi:hypothetical protein